MGGEWNDGYIRRRSNPDHLGGPDRIMGRQKERLSGSVVALFLEVKRKKSNRREEISPLLHSPLLHSPGNAGA